MNLDDIFNYLKDNLRIVVNCWGEPPNYEVPGSSTVSVAVYLKYPITGEEVLIAEGEDTV